jgi:hypothetical protein
MIRDVLRVVTLPLPSRHTRRALVGVVGVNGLHGVPASVHFVVNTHDDMKSTGVWRVLLYFGHLVFSFLGMTDWADIEVVLFTCLNSASTPFPALHGVKCLRIGNDLLGHQLS